MALPVRRLRPPSSAPLLLTNYRGAGIGDFGAGLGDHLSSRIGSLRTEETGVNGEGFSRQSVLVATYPGPVIANIGLTAWGRSGFRNFSGFASLGIHASTGHPTICIVHHAIEILDSKETGYPISGLVRWGAHAALRRLRRCDLVVFSPRLKDLLMRAYSAKSVWLVPLPGNQCRDPPTGPREAKPKVVTAGYWAPYKGIDTYLDTVAQLGPVADFYMIGRPHRLLSQDSAFAANVERWKARAEQLGVNLPGFLEPGVLDLLLSGQCTGVLPYTSVSGASASFQMFAERGIPVVASDLPEFRYLEKCGAGVLLAPATAEGMSAAIGNVLKDSAQWSQLVAKQVAFSQRYSWESFTEELVTRYHLTGDQVPMSTSVSREQGARGPGP